MFYFSKVQIPKIGYGLIVSHKGTRCNRKLFIPFLFFVRTNSDTYHISLEHPQKPLSQQLPRSPPTDSPQQIRKDYHAARQQIADRQAPSSRWTHQQTYTITSKSQKISIFWCICQLFPERINCQTDHLGSWGCF